MDAHDIFKKLTFGVKFNSKKMKDSSKNFKVFDRIDKVEQNNIANIKEECEFNLNKQLTNTDFSFNNAENTFNFLNDSNNETSLKSFKKQNAFSEEKITKLKQEEINHYRNINNISVVGRHIATPIKQFSELFIGDDLKNNIIQSGYSDPTPIQMQAIPIMLDNRQLLACAPTGSGKTAAFLIPIIHTLERPQRQGFRAVIVVPTRELATQIHRECIRLSDGRGLRVHVINKVNKAIEKFGTKSSQKFDILVTTPKRLCYLLNQDPPAISLTNVQWLIIDEADKLFEIGVRGFRDQLTQILAACSNVNRKVAMFSATHTPAVAFWCRHNMRGLITLTVGQRNAATETVQQELVFVGNEAGKLLAFRDLVKKGITPPVLIFVQSKERAQQLFSELIYDGLNVDVIHADRTQLQRDNTVRAFREGQIWVLICTELMARGIDFKGVNLVINYDFPPSSISYIHRVGRAGRAGRTGYAITYFTTDDTINLRSIAQILKQSGCEVPNYMLTLKKRGKTIRKQLEKSAPHREDISTIPKFDLQRKANKRKRQQDTNKDKLSNKKLKEGKEINDKRFKSAVKNKPPPKKIKNMKLQGSKIMFKNKIREKKIPLG